MSDHPDHAQGQGNDQLFKGIDEQERLYAPEEVPDTEVPAEEVDAGGTAASGTAVSSSDLALTNVASEHDTEPTAWPHPGAGAGHTQPVPIPASPSTDTEGVAPHDEAWTTGRES